LAGRWQNRSVIRTVCIAVLALAASLSAIAQQRPLITDDIDITPPGSVSLGVGVDFLQNVKFPLSGLNGDLTRIADIRLRQGFASNVEVQIEGSIRNYLAINSQTVPSPIELNINGNSTSDFDDYTISTKIKLRNERGKLPAFGIKFGFQCRTPTSHAASAPTRSTSSRNSSFKRNSARQRTDRRKRTFSATSALGS
jgi:hypothetical protein